jgi:PhnB protein
VSPESKTEVTAVQVNLFCDDVETAAQFYATLGFPAVFRAPKEGAPEHIEVDVAGTRIGLTSTSAVNRIEGLDVTAQTGAISEVVLWCNDADEMFAKALKAGATELASPRNSPDNRIRYGWVQDPESHQLKFVAPL